MRNSIKAPTTIERRIIKIMVLIGLFSILNFLFFFFQPENRGNILLFVLLSTTILYSAFRKLYMWYNYANISIPDPPETTPELTVDILTTYFPGEPYQMVITSLEAILKITYPHTTYLCDEANDPLLKKFCEENGIVHVTRNNRINAKAGNINNALEKKAKGDICVILDPDHIPEPDFLDPILPYFSDPEIGFVQIVQSYYNIKETLVARGAAEQTFQFYGPMMMTLNAYQTVNAIGANCVFRRKALDSIGGHAPGLCEDMHTAMLLYAAGWKAVYLPEVLAKGLAPSSLTTYYKQQLKWARGTFDLLFKVYPKVFSRLTTRQKIHFGILPLHYLCGVIYFINFLIPILALFLSTTPWRGNIVVFILALLPLAGSAFFIRTFVQKWVIEKEERGFHIVGGLLQINTWWIYFLGFLYTLIDKKVPYLPTPKQNEFSTNLKIIIPNAIIALVSVVAVLYGLQQDFTPFSLIMAGFALFNAGIMVFGIYMAIAITNQNRVLRSAFTQETVATLWNIKQALRRAFHASFTIIRKAALPLLVVVLISALAFKKDKEENKWSEVEPYYFQKQSANYLGIFRPPGENGLVDLEDINSIEARQDLNFDIISFYLAWTDESVEDFPTELLNSIANKNAIPMITWEPWASPLSIADSIPELQKEQKVFRYVAEGLFDSYISAFAKKLADFDHPVFLRFAHEFNNPSYPWSSTGANTSEEFKTAWKHVYNIFEAEGASNVVFVWNPWEPETMSRYYPGNKYVDWVGLTALNYGPLNPDMTERPFREMYKQFQDSLEVFTSKPVMLAEFGSVDLGGSQEQWIAEALQAVEEDFSEIDAIVFFESGFDQNIPANNWYKKKYIDWSNNNFPADLSYFNFSAATPETKTNSLTRKPPPVSLKQYEIKGSRYKKSENWRENYYVVSRDVLLEDLRKMKQAGLNTLQFKGGSVYEYNILKYSSDLDLQVIYEFDLDHEEGYLEEPERLRQLRESILEKVRDLQDEQSVIGFTFNADLDHFFTEPLSQFQKKAFLAWFQNLALDIKKIAPQKLIILDVPLTTTTKTFLAKYDDLPVDAFGLIVENPNLLEDIKNYAAANNIQILLSAIDPSIVAENVSKYEDSPVIFENWQDERLTNKISFDGLIDFHGRPKASLRKIATADNEKTLLKDLKLRILKPVVSLIPGMTEKYHAIFYEGQGWTTEPEGEEELLFEWSLIKLDDFGTPLALKPIGSGNAVNVLIPHNYENYELLLTVYNKEKDFVIQRRSQLHTPLNRE